MKQTFLIYLLLLTTSFGLLTSCKDDDDSILLSQKAEITAFTINGTKATIDKNNIKVTLPSGNDIKNLKAGASISEKATILPSPTTIKDFSNPVVFTVTAEDGSTEKKYTVMVSIAPPEASSLAKITEFTINGTKANINNNNITLSVPYDTDVKAINAQAIISNNANISPDPTTVTNYTKPVVFTVTAEDGTSQEKYTVTLIVNPIVPTINNPYAEGIFITSANGSESQLDFKHTSGAIDSKIFQTANNGKSINGVTITDIIPHKKGYLIFLNMLDGSGAKIYFTDLTLKIKKEVKIAKANVEQNRYAVIGNKVYYTNVSNSNEFNQPENASYIIDTEQETVKILNKNIYQYLRFFADSNNNLYYQSLDSKIHRVTDYNNLTGTEIATFRQNSESFVLHDNKIWSSYADYEVNFTNIFNKARGYLNYKLGLICYDLNTKKTIKYTSTVDINRNSKLFVNQGKLYIITNQNKQLISNAKKQIEEVYLDGNVIKRKAYKNLPKVTAGSGALISNDIRPFSITNSKVVVWGSAVELGGRYYYDLDINSGTVSNRVIGYVVVFPRQVIP